MIEHLDHYITATAMQGEWVILACRCGWMQQTANPRRVWEEHWREADHG